MVVANPDNSRTNNTGSRLHPGSLCGKFADMLRRVAPDLRNFKSSSEDDGILTQEGDNPPKGYEPDITPRFSFEEFIQTEMD